MTRRSLIAYLGIFLMISLSAQVSAQTGKVILEVPGIDSGKRLPAIESRFKDMPGILHQFYCSESNTVYFEVNSESLAIIQEQFHSMAIICNVKQQSSLQKIQNACNNGTE